MIKGVFKRKLKVFEDNRGKVMHMLKSNDSTFMQFGEIYFSWVFPNAIKAWTLHKEIICNFAIPCGSLKIVLYDDREGSKTHGQINEIILGEDEYHLLTIPNNIWYGFVSSTNAPSLVANCATLPHIAEEVRKRDYNDPRIPYKWR